MDIMNVMKVTAKTIQGKTVTVDLKRSDLVLRGKDLIAKELNKQAIAEGDKTYRKVFPGQLKLSFKETELRDEQTFNEAGVHDSDTLAVLVGREEDVRIKMKAQLFKGGGVDTHPLDLTLADTGDNIKDRLVAASFGPNNKSYTLFIKGQPLLDNRKICDYDVDNGSIILVGVIMK